MGKFIYFSFSQNQIAGSKLQGTGFEPNLIVEKFKYLTTMYNLRIIHSPFFNIDILKVCWFFFFELFPFLVFAK